MLIGPHLQATEAASTTQDLRAAALHVVAAFRAHEAAVNRVDATATARAYGELRERVGELERAAGRG